MRRGRAFSLVMWAMLWDLPGRPSADVLHRALRTWAFLGLGARQHDVPVQGQLVLHRVAMAPRPLVSLHDPVLARGVPEALRRKRDGGTAAPETVRPLVNALYCVGSGGRRWCVLKQTKAGRSAGGGQRLPGAGPGGRGLLCRPWQAGRGQRMVRLFGGRLLRRAAPGRPSP